MTKPIKEYFPAVKEAREALKEKALEHYDLQLKLIMEAVNRGDIESALKANQWLLEHMPSEDGVRLIDPSAAKPKEIESTHKGPAIQIGIQLGGINAPKSLPPVSVIDVDTDE